MYAIRQDIYLKWRKKHRSKILFSLSLSSLWNGKVGGKKIVWREMKKIPKQFRKKCQHFWTTITPMCTSLFHMTMATITMTATIIINNSRIYFKRHLVKYIGDTHTHTHTTRECCHSLSRILMSPLDVYQNVYFYPIVFYSFLTISCILYRSRKF